MARGAWLVVAVSAGLMLAPAGSANAQPRIHASLVEDINPGVERSIPDGFVPIDDTSVLFSAFEPTSGRELWLSTGPYIASTTDVVKDINPGSAGSFPSRLTKAGRAVFFAADDGTTGQELWKTDGTAEGTALVKDIRSGPDRSLPIQLTDVNGTLFFSADDGLAGRELWKSDGTAQGTVLVKDIFPGVPVASSHVIELTDVNGTLFFSAIDATGFAELWKSDGTAEGTVLVKDIDPVGGSDPSQLTNVGGTLFFLASDGVTGAELWKSDGTAEGTVLVKDIHPVGSSLPTGLTNVRGTLFFVASDPDHGRELWKSDGTAEGTVLVKDITPGPDSSFPNNPFVVGDVSLLDVGPMLFFAASDPDHGRELWKSDGTAKRTVLVRDINAGPGHSIPNAPGSRGDVISANLTAVDDTVIFRAFDPVHGLEPWRSDGSAEGTVLVEDINRGPGNAIPDGTPGTFANVDGTVLFTAANSCIDPTRLRCDFEPWKTAPRIR
jgi:ELWxxDGT repeat protein